MTHENAGAQGELAAEVPQPLSELVSAWRDNGQSSQPGIPWPQERWVAAFPEQTTILRALPARLDRNAVQAIGASAASDPDAATAAFITVLAWGYGRVGYGVWRAQQALAVPLAAERLFDAAVALRNRGALAGYAQLAEGTHRLPYFGPAFGTKFLALCAGTDGNPPLILDRLVARWLKGNAGLSFDARPWNVRTYGRYLDVMNAWAESLAVPADVLELCIFSEESRRVDNQWAAKT